MAQIDLEDIGNGRQKWSNQTKITILIYLLTTIFWFGASYASFATKEDVENRDNKIIEMVAQQNKDVLVELKTLNAQVAALTAGKVDKPNIIK
jgi:hypothetical protein